MNIFALDYNINKCVKYHCDRHVVKMILELAQMLSTALRPNGIKKGYKATHINHPCTIWPRASLSNWEWLSNLARHLKSEYKFRFKKQTNHSSWNLIHSLPYPPIKDKGLTKFAQVMPSIYKSEDTVTAYRNFYVAEKVNILSWTSRKTPEWVR